MNKEMRSIEELPKDASRSRMEGASRRGAYSFVHDSRRATEDKEMRSIFGQGGVTLVELVVVLAILVTLATVGIVEFYGQSEKTRRESALVAVEGMAKGLQMYYADHNENYPSVSESLSVLSRYVNIDDIQGSVINPKFLSGSGGKAVGIGADVRKISPTYSVNYYVRGVSPPAEARLDQPICQWSGKHSWQPCRQGL